MLGRAGRIPNTSEVEQKAQRTADLERDLSAHSSESSNQALHGNGLNVLALRVAHLVEAGTAPIYLYMRRQVTPPGCDRDHDHDAGATIVQRIGRHDQGGSPACLLSPDGITEVD
jgi:hypothetical protein